MRRLFYLVFALVLLTGCIRNEESTLPFNPDDVTFYATNADMAETKTVLQADGTIQWLPKDEINVFYSGTESARFVSNNTENAAQVAFKGALKDFTYREGASFWAVYPYRESHTFSGEALTVSLPANQVAVAGSFADDLFVSIARTTNFNLQFYNVCGGIEFSVTEPGVKTVTFKGNGDEPLAGSADVSFGQDGKPVILNVTEAATSITLTTPDGSAFQTGVKYYIALWPATLENGYRITLTKEDGTSTIKKYSKSVMVKRAVWGVLEDLDKGLSYEHRVPDNEIWYTSTDGKIIEGSGAVVPLSNTYVDGRGIMVFNEPLTSITWDYFYNSDRLETVMLPESVTDIGMVAFAMSTSLITIDMPGVVRIDYQAFDSSGLSGELILPDTVEEIGGFAFFNCKGLQRIVLPEKVKRLGEGAFLESGFKEMIVKPLTPPIIESDYYSIDIRDGLWERNSLIYVPEESLEAYQSARMWSDSKGFITTEGKMPNECFYASTDYSHDGEVVYLQTATVGNGVDLIFLGDGYVDRDLDSGGIFEQRVKTEVESFFSFEPYKSLRDRFNVVMVKCVSKNDVYFTPFGAERLFTYDKAFNAFDTYEERCAEYAKLVTRSETKPIFAAVLLNRQYDGEAAFCNNQWDLDRAFAYFSDRRNSGDDAVGAHELGGHGIARLADEYIGFGMAFPEEDQAREEDFWRRTGWGINIDFCTNPEKVKWAHFLKDTRYQDEGLGIWEGGMARQFGVYRCSEESVMNGTGGYGSGPSGYSNWFNAPSREAIYKKIMKLSEGPDWQYDYETFAVFDAPGREQAATKYREWQQAYEEWRKNNPNAKPALSFPAARPILRPGDGKTGYCIPADCRR